jgi:hypothetical protein
VVEFAGEFVVASAEAAMQLGCSGLATPYRCVAMRIEGFKKLAPGSTVDSRLQGARP